MNPPEGPDVAPGGVNVAPEGPDAAPGGRQTWAGAAREVWRTATRHKLASGLIALAVIASLIAVALAAAGPSGPASTPRRPRSACRLSASRGRSRSATTPGSRSS